MRPGSMTALKKLDACNAIGASRLPLSGPASSRSTDRRGFSERPSARTAPAEPAPTTMTSYAVTASPVSLHPELRAQVLEVPAQGGDLFAKIGQFLAPRRTARRRCSGRSGGGRRQLTDVHLSAEQVGVAVFPLSGLTGDPHHQRFLTRRQAVE